MEIPKIKLITSPETEDAKLAVGYQWNNIAGTRHFLGGKPDNLDEVDFPLCDQCSNKMTFYAQIDSIGDNYDLADCMVIQTFICFDCNSVKSQLNQGNKD